MSPAGNDVLPAYERDGSLPFDELVPAAPGRPWSDRRIALAIALGLAVVAAVIVGALVVHGHESSSASAPTVAAAGPSGMTPSTTQDGRDVSQLSNDELEAAVNANPNVISLRLTLVARYLHAADLETDAGARVQQLDKAKFHATEAFNRATTAADQATALRYMGWTTANTTDPSQGATFLEESLQLVPDDPDSLWYLAIVRGERLQDPADAVPLLQTLAAKPDLSDSQRQAVQHELDKLNASVAGK